MTTPSSCIDEGTAAAAAAGSHSAEEEEATAQWLSGLDDSTYVDWLPLQGSGLHRQGQWETGVIARFSDFRTELEIVQEDGGCWLLVGEWVHVRCHYCYCCCLTIHLSLHHQQQG